MYTSSIDMIKKAQAGHYAVPAFNAENLEMVQAIVRAATAGAREVLKVSL